MYVHVHVTNAFSEESNIEKFNCALAFENSKMHMTSKLANGLKHFSTQPDQFFTRTYLQNLGPAHPRPACNLTIPEIYIYM